MALELTAETKREIAGWLDSGMDCFYHLPSGKLEWFPNESRFPDMDETQWADVIKKVRKHFKEYVGFEGMDSLESFTMMEDFIDELPDKELQEKFANVIQRRSPFQQFKGLLLDYPDVRKQWFAYKDQQLIELVEEQLESYNRRLEE